MILSMQSTKSSLKSMCNLQLKTMFL